MAAEGARRRAGRVEQDGVEAAPGLDEWTFRGPARSLYLQLPPNLFWASIGTDVPPEPVDGFFAIFPSCYDAPAAYAEATGVYSNKAPGGIAYRCSFRVTEAIYLMERTMDVLADELDAVDDVDQVAVDQVDLAKLGIDRPAAAEVEPAGDAPPDDLPPAPVGLIGDVEAMPDEEALGEGIRRRMSFPAAVAIPALPTRERQAARKGSHCRSAPMPSASRYQRSFPSYCRASCVQTRAASGPRS